MDLNDAAAQPMANDTDRSIYYYSSASPFGCCWGQLLPLPPPLTKLAWCTAVPISPWVNPSSGVESGVNLCFHSSYWHPFYASFLILVVSLTLLCANTWRPAAQEQWSGKQYNLYNHLTSASKYIALLHCQQSVNDTGNWRVAWPGNVVWAGNNQSVSCHQGFC